MKEPVFLPLEWFDAGVPAENALPLSTWENMNGKSKWYYSNGDWEWRSVTILEYNQESARFHIQWNNRPKREIKTMSFFLTLGGGSGKGKLTKNTGVSKELEEEVEIPTELENTAELPTKWVSRANLW